VNRDPLREHIANPRGGRTSMRPMIDSAFKLLTEGRRFTPIGIAVAVALPPAIFVGLLYLVLGRDGLVQITSAWGESAEANKALASEIAALRADLAAYSARTEATQKDLSLVNHRLSLTCDLTTELNAGRPREDWCGPPGQGTRFFAPSLGALTPLHLTHAPWTPQ
jgi:hypothetical protein